MVALKVSWCGIRRRALPQLGIGPREPPSQLSQPTAQPLENLGRGGKVHRVDPFFADWPRSLTGTFLCPSIVSHLT